MTTSAIPPAVGAHGRGLHVTMWVLQVLLALFFLAAAAGPKLLGQQYAVDMFALIGAGQWLRYLVGVLELAGAIGLLIPRLTGLAALGLTALMAGAAITQIVVPGLAGPVLTPAILGVLCALVAWGRWSQTRALAATIKR